MNETLLKNPGLIDRIQGANFNWVRGALYLSLYRADTTNHLQA